MDADSLSQTGRTKPKVLGIPAIGQGFCHIGPPQRKEVGVLDHNKELLVLNI
jgi:hypothetical protein